MYSIHWPHRHARIEDVSKREHTVDKVDKDIRAMRMTWLVITLVYCGVVFYTWFKVF